jgi:hypothetical protein
LYGYSFGGLSDNTKHEPWPWFGTSQHDVCFCSNVYMCKKSLLTNFFIFTSPFFSTNFIIFDGKFRENFGKFFFPSVNLPNFPNIEIIHHFGIILSKNLYQFKKKKNPNLYFENMTCDPDYLLCPCHYKLASEDVLIPCKNKKTS